jgi:hypothetical protein
MTNSSSINGRMGANMALTVKLINQRYHRKKRNKDALPFSSL